MTGQDPVSNWFLQSAERSLVGRDQEGKVQSTLGGGAAHTENLKGGIQVVENRTLPDLNFYGISLKRNKHQTLGTSNNKCHGFYDHGLYGHLVVLKKKKNYPKHVQLTNRFFQEVSGHTGEGSRA